MQAIGLRTYVWNNAWKSALLLAGFPVLLVLICFALALVVVAWAEDSILKGLRDAAGLVPVVLPAALGLSALWFAIAWAANQRILDALTGARPVSRQQEPRLWNAVETLCISRGLRMPRLAVIETPARNAFASGLSREAGAITVTRGLLDALDDAELAAVLAHEVTHIRNGDARLAVIAAVFAGIISLPGEMLIRGGRAIFSGRSGGGRSSSSGGGSWGSSSSSSSSSSRRKGGGDSGGGATAILLLIALAIMAIAYVLALALRFALSRNREFIADAGAVELTKDPDALIRALRKVDQNSEIPRLPSSVQAMLLDSPEETLGNAWLATHPDMSERIAALVRYAGGRDAGPEAARRMPAAAATARDPASAPPPPWWRQA